jgi:hypothetical protein
LASRNYEYQSDFARRHFGQGKAEALLTVLAARGLEVPDEARQRILSCTDLSLLDTWLTRAVTASSASEVLRED